MKKIYFFIFLLIASNALHAQSLKSTCSKFVKVPAGYIMVLREGDNIIKEIELLTMSENIPSASFTGFGFVNMTFGFFNFNTKKYNPKKFSKMELSSMNGSIAWQNGKPSIHAHGTVTGKNFKAYGGHILEGTVSTGSVEITITVHDKKLERIFEEPLGANVLCVGSNNP